MGLYVGMSILLILFWSTHKLAWAQSDPSKHPEAGNIDLPYLGPGDWGEPTKFCKDIWTLCGLWAYDWSYNPPPCCRSKGANAGIVCRTPSRDRKEFAGGFSNLHKSFCLPIFDGYTNWSRMSRFGGGGGGGRSPFPGGSMDSSRGETGALFANEEIVEQLQRIADALTAGKKT